MRKKFLSLLLAISVLAGSVASEVDVSAAGKTIGAYKNTNFETDKTKVTYGSDANTIFTQVTNYDKKYNGEYLFKNKITSAHFYTRKYTIKYWSSHGYNDGTMSGDSNIHIDIFNDKKSFTWAGDNLEFAFLAACNQLSKNGKAPVKKYAKAMLGDKAVRVICGYHDNAPAIADNLVAKKFMQYAKTGESVKSSWIKANEYVAGKGYTNPKNYAVLTHTGNVQYSRFPGFSGTTYARPGKSSKTIIRFRRGVTNGENILKSSSKLAVKKGLSVLNSGYYECNIPNYVLEKKDIKFKVNSDCKDIAFNDGNILTLDGGEIASNQVDMKKSEICEDLNNYISENIENSSNLEINNRDIEITPILMDEVTSDTSKDVAVGYSIKCTHKYDGYEIVGDGCSAVVDNTGVKNATIKWSKVEKRKLSKKYKKVSYSEAIDKMYGGKNILKSKLKGLSPQQISLLRKTFNISIKFVYNKRTSVYEPNYCLRLANGCEKYIPCYRNKK